MTEPDPRIALEVARVAYTAARAAYREAVKVRTAAIRDAMASGLSVREIGRLLDVSHVVVLRLLKTAAPERQSEPAPVVNDGENRRRMD